MKLEKHCKNCGEILPEGAEYCRNCGFKINSQKESFFKKNQFPIIFLAIVLITAIITIAAFSFVNDSGSQTVDVASIAFKIPSEFEENVSAFSAEDDGGIITISKTWESSTDFIRITAMYSNATYIDANEVNEKIGGHKQTMLGYSGFLHKSHGIYSFSFVKKNMLITVYTSNQELFEKIAVS